MRGRFLHYWSKECRDVFSISLHMVGDLWVFIDGGGGVAAKPAAAVGLGAFCCLCGLCAVGGDEGFQCDAVGAVERWRDVVSLFGVAAFAAAFVLDSAGADFLCAICQKRKGA